MGAANCQRYCASWLIASSATSACVRGPISNAVLLGHTGIGPEPLGVATSMRPNACYTLVISEPRPALSSSMRCRDSSNWPARFLRCGIRLSYGVWASESGCEQSSAPLVGQNRAGAAEPHGHPPPELLSVSGLAAGDEPRWSSMPLKQVFVPHFANNSSQRVSSAPVRLPSWWRPNACAGQVPMQQAQGFAPSSCRKSWKVTSLPFPPSGGQIAWRQTLHCHPEHPVILEDFTDHFRHLRHKGTFIAPWRV